MNPRQVDYRGIEREHQVGGIRPDENRLCNRCLAQDDYAAPNTAWIVQL
jgi:hypothetical protein